MIDNATVQAVQETCKTAKQMAICNKEDNQKAIAYCQGIKKLIKQINSIFEPVIDAQKQALKTTKAECEKYIAPLQEAELCIKKAMQAYLLASEAETKRLQQELEAKAIKLAEDRRLEQARKLEALGAKDEAEKLLDKPIVVNTVQLKNEKEEGQSTKDIWSGVVKDKRAFVEACLKGEGHATLDMIEPSIPTINKIIRALHENTNITGVEVIKETTIAIRQ